MISPYKCLHCGEEFGAFAGVTSHIQKTHGVVSPSLRRDYVNAKILQAQHDDMCGKFAARMKLVVGADDFIMECENSK